MMNTKKKKGFVMTTNEDTKKYLEGKGIECIGKGNVGKDVCYYFASSSSLFDSLDFSKLELMHTNLLLF